MHLWFTGTRGSGPTVRASPLRWRRCGSKQNAKEVTVSRFDHNVVMIGSHIAIIVGSLLIGYGANSWCIAGGVYLSLVCVSERIEIAIKAAKTAP